MKKIQVTLVQIDNYGPWTVSPEPKPEAKLQTLQARLFADLVDEFSSRGGLAFFARFDNILAVSNQISLDQHLNIQKNISEKYPVTVSMGISVGETARIAQQRASRVLQREGSCQSSERKEVLAGRPLSRSDESWVRIAHIDINRVSSLTDSESFYQTYNLIEKVHSTLGEELEKLGALEFYIGGDNFMALSNGLAEKRFEKPFAIVREKTGVELKAGIGCGATAEEAAGLADESLHDVREGGTSSRIVAKEV